MQRTRTTLILGVILIATPGLRGQTTHSGVHDGSACPHCQPPQACPSAGSASAGGLASWAARLDRALGGILPGSVGCDARHKIYKSALRRSTFDKKLVPVVPYYEHVFPCYAENRYHTGPLVPRATEYPAEYAGEVMGEDMMPVEQAPRHMGKPTPATRPDGKKTKTEPSRVKPTEETSQKFWQPGTLQPATPAEPASTPSGQGRIEKTKRPRSPQSDLGQFISLDN